jgi:hypothetical protein
MKALGSHFAMPPVKLANSVAAQSDSGSSSSTSAVVTGLGTEFRHQEGDVVVIYQVGEADIGKMTQPCTTYTLKSDKPAEPKDQPRVQGWRDWASQLAAEEAYVSDAAAFHRGIDVLKMIHIVTYGGARPIPGKAGCGATIRQNKSFTMV